MSCQNQWCKGVRETHLIGAFHGSDKDARVGGVDAQGFVEESSEVFCCFYVIAIHGCRYIPTIL